MFPLKLTVLSRDDRTPPMIIPTKELLAQVGTSQWVGFAGSGGSSGLSWLGVPAGLGVKQRPRPLKGLGFRV